jgi:tetratricopeptide (TPR) repeat protein
MAPTDWFRSTDWGEAAERDFRQRLARARPHNQIQYRRIKAVTLLDTGDPAKATSGQRLLIEIVDSAEAPEFEKVMALSMLGERALREGRLDEAEANLREALRISGPDSSGTSGLEEVWLAQVALARGDRAGLPEARALVERRAAYPHPFLNARFETCLTAAKVAMALEDRAEAATWAQAALRLADADHSGLANHPTLGLVRLSSQTRAWLSDVAGRA